MSRKFNPNKNTKGKIVARGKTQERAYSDVLEEAKSKEDYVRNLVKGRYFLARCNMLANQLVPGAEILESIDGTKKSEEYMLSEYALIKYQGINSNRDAHFAKKELTEKYKYTKEMITALEEGFYNGKIIREEYDEKPKKNHEAKFVNTK